MRYIEDIVAMGRQVAKAELPKVRVVVKRRGLTCWIPRKKRIDWNPENGLTGLFHEMAHAQLGHKIEVHRLDAPNKQELSAWHRAETIAHKWGICFDYHFAEYCLMTHTPSVVILTDAFKVAWRYVDR